MLYLAAVAVMILSLIIQAWLKATVKKWSKVDAGTGYNANSAVEKMFEDNDINNIAIDHKGGELTDCYSPNDGRIFLSDTTYGQSSVAAIAVAAHECGHAIQDKVGSPIYRLRQKLVVPANIGSRAGVYIALIGLLIASAAQMSDLGMKIANIGVWMYFITFLFYLVMVPVEIGASARGLQSIKTNGFIKDEYVSGARKVLTAAASTYVISMASAGVSFLRILSMVNGGNSRRR